VVCGTEAKEQVLANLANFAYDPINYDTLFELHVPDLFLDALDEPNPKFVEFAIAGICNCCLGNIRGHNHTFDRLFKIWKSK
jgi:hypothetical protein